MKYQVSFCAKNLISAQAKMTCLHIGKCHRSYNGNLITHAFRSESGMVWKLISVYIIINGTVHMAA